jgi:type II secretory pathway component PulM
VKKFFAQLRPLERRLAVGALVVLILVLNAVFIWPHHSDWANLKDRIATARKNLARYRDVIAQSANYDALVKSLANQGEFVASEDMAINFMRTIQSQSAASGVGIANTSRQMTRTNEFFTEQTQNITVTATDSQLVDFLYKLGNDASMIRVRELELQPDGAHHFLNANIQLVASYQKNPAAVSPAAPVQPTAPVAPAASAVKAVPPAPKPRNNVAPTNSKPATKTVK